MGMTHTEHGAACMRMLSVLHEQPGLCMGRRMARILGGS